jgi:hypothetical protein
MRKKVLLGMIGLAGCLALPAAHGDGFYKDTPGKKDGITRAVTVELKGQLIWNKLPLRCRAPEFVLVVNGERYDLRLGADAKLRRLARDLAGQTVIVTGTRPTGPVDHPCVAVSGLKADSSVTTSVGVEIKGKLVRGKRYFTGLSIVNALGSWPVYHYAWSIRVGRDTYHLDLGGEAQHQVAESLSGKTVIVTGTLVGDRVKVAGLKEDKDRVQKTTVVEVRGKLTRRLIAASSHPHSKDIERFREVWIVEAEGKAYELDFPKGLPLSIARLEGKTVVASGTLTGNRIVVTQLQPDASGAAKQTVNVEVRGKLCQDQNGAWKVEVEGTLYTLEFGASKEFSRRAAKNRGANVVIRGALKDGVVTVRDMEFPGGETVVVSRDGGNNRL